MRFNLRQKLPALALGVALPLFAPSVAHAQGRIIVPEGSVLVVRTTTPLESSTARVGQTFETTIEEAVGIDNYVVIPSGSRIRGVVTFAQAATRQQSGVIEVDFNRLLLSDGTSYTIDGRLTSLDSAERRQIESDPNARVLLVGGRGGIGAAIAGAGSRSSSSSSILGALGGLLSEGRNVSVPAGTPLAVELEQGITLRGRSRLAGNDNATIFTAAERIRSAQEALSRLNYYRGPLTGQLDDATRRALFEYQLDQRIRATGNLDMRTARALGLNLGGDLSGGALSLEDASTLRRNAQSVVGRQRQELGMSTTGRLMANRTYTQGDIELWFALSAFADNASLYETLIRTSTSSDATVLAGRALVASARRVDAALQTSRASSALRSAWTTIRGELSGLDPQYSIVN